MAASIGRRPDNEIGKHTALNAQETNPLMKHRWGPTQGQKRQGQEINSEHNKESGFQNKTDQTDHMCRISRQHTMQNALSLITDSLFTFPLSSVVLSIFYCRRSTFKRGRLLL